MRCSETTALMHACSEAYNRKEYTSLGSSCPQCVHQILLLSAHAYMHFYLNGIQCVHNHSLLYTLDPIYLYRNAFMHEETTTSIHEEEVPKLMYTLFWCKPECLVFQVNFLQICTKCLSDLLCFTNDI